MSEDSAFAVVRELLLLTVIAGAGLNGDTFRWFKGIMLSPNELVRDALGSTVKCVLLRTVVTVAGGPLGFTNRGTYPLRLWTILTV